MKTISIVDTSICTDNLGDEIIMDAVNSVVWELFPDAYVFRVPSHEALSDRTRKFIEQSDYCFIGGTNLLSSNISQRGLWRIGPQDADYFAGANTVCLGVGWNDYMERAQAETERLLKQTLSGRLVHSVRDSYTRKHLADVGIEAVTTSCPTTWQLTPEVASRVSSQKAQSAVVTLSAWRSDVEADRAFVEVVRKLYKTVYFFPQMQDDWEYLLRFGWEDIKCLTPTAEAYTKFLENEDVDFIGTRLHGGIRALQKGRRALILAIDNRAAEISRDTGLPTADRAAAGEIEAWIADPKPTVLKLPQTQIDAWKAQFAPDRRLARPVAPAPIFKPEKFSVLGRAARKIARKVP